MAGDTLPNKDAAQELHLYDADLKKFFLDWFQSEMAVDQKQWKSTLLEKLQSFHGNDATMNFKKLLVTYNMLAATTEVSEDVMFQNFWKASEKYFELAKHVPEHQACAEISQIAVVIHSHWADAWLRNLDNACKLEAFEQAARDTLTWWSNPEALIPSDCKPDERFLQQWEAERQRREIGIIGAEFAKIRTKEATVEDVEDTDALDPDCFRYEARGYPDESSSTIHPPSPAKNSRAGRQFGQHRFLTLRLGKCRDPPRQHFTFLGRRYCALYWRLPDQVTFFAEEGDGLPSWRVHEVMDWLVRLLPNKEMTILKYNQRLQLSFSETRAEVQLKVHEDEDLWDVNKKFCLSDGCGCISMAAAQRCALKLGFEEVPGVFQARCGNFKGLWVIDPQQDEEVDLIVRPSQKKYELAEMAEEFDFEVLKTSSKPLHSDLTPNSIQALESLGAKPELFKQRQEEILNTLRQVFHEEELVARDALQELMASNMMKPGNEKALREMMDLEMPWFHFPFRDLRQRACAELRSRCCEQLKLPLKCARRAWIVPDHTQELQQGECFLQLPHNQGISLAGKEVLLIRAPCYHSSSVLKLRIPEEAPKLLQHLSNVVVLNAMAERSQPADAEVMGGDHDGDTVLAIWDEELVAHVQTTSSSLQEAETPVRELQRIQNVDPDQLAERILAELPAAAESHAAFCEADKKRRDWADQEKDTSQGFGEKTTHLASICKAGVDCASNGRIITVPEDLKHPELPDWADKGRNQKRSYESQSACGLLKRARCQFHDRKEEHEEFLSAAQLGLNEWKPEQILEATNFVLKNLHEFHEQMKRIQYQSHLARSWRSDLEKALFRCAASAKHDFPEGLVGAAAYLVYLSARTKCKSISSTQRDIIQEAVENMLKLSQMQNWDPPSLPAKEIWRLNEREILTTLSIQLHGSCPHKPGESFLIDPVQIRFSHPSISPQFRSGLPLVEAVQKLISGAMRKRDFAKTGMPLPVRWYKGHWHTMGNRRLAIYRLYKFHLPENKSAKDALVLVRRVNEAEAFRWPWHRKFEIDEREGRSINIRELEAVVGETAEETTVGLWGDEVMGNDGNCASAVDQCKFTRFI